MCFWVCSCGKAACKDKISTPSGLVPSHHLDPHSKARYLGGNVFGYGKPGLGPPTIAAHNVFLSREAEGNGKYKRGEQHFGVIKPFFPLQPLGLSRAWNIWELAMGWRMPVLSHNLTRQMLRMEKPFSVIKQLLPNTYLAILESLIWVPELAFRTDCTGHVPVRGQGGLWRQGGCFLLWFRRKSKSLSAG